MKSNRFQNLLKEAKYSILMEWNEIKLLKFKEKEMKRRYKRSENVMNDAKDIMEWDSIERNGMRYNGMMNRGFILKNKNTY